MNWRSLKKPGIPRWLSGKDPAYEAEDAVQSLGLEDSLEKEMETHSSILALKIPWTEEPGRLQSTGLQRVRQDLVTKTTTTKENLESKTNPFAEMNKLCSKT